MQYSQLFGYAFTVKGGESELQHLTIKLFFTNLNCFLRSKLDKNNLHVDVITVWYLKHCYKRQNVTKITNLTKLFFKKNNSRCTHVRCTRSSGKLWNQNCLNLNTKFSKNTLQQLTSELDSILKLIGKFS